MKKNFALYLLILLHFSIAGCTHSIKNNTARITDEVHDSTDSVDRQPIINTGNTNLHVRTEADLIGNWVGIFDNAADDIEERAKSALHFDEGLSWYRQNKINISIQTVKNGKISGKSVVAGNDRPFTGSYTKTDNIYKFVVREPGDDKYDGEFTFQITEGDTSLIGTWAAFKRIEIPNRKYELQKKIFSYQPVQMLQKIGHFVDWDKFVTESNTYGEGSEEEIESYTEFASSTDSIYQINASNTVLKKEDVENLKRGDLYIIRNTIYARHGYSFKNRPLRVFFDQQPWYIPVHVDIKKDLTDIEKNNIQLLMRYEKNAKEYYDYFGRG